jgi:hypothetical protein
MNKEFLSSFARTIGASEIEADEQWTGYSRQMSDRERSICENEGAKTGIYMGKCFLELYPKKIGLVLMLMALTLSASGRSLTISASPNITRNAGQSIPLSFTASGFLAGSTAQIWLYNAKTWAGEVVEIDVPVKNGVNNHPVVIPWSWDPAGPYVVKVVSGSTQCWDSRVVTIRTAVIWPYAGTVYPANSIISVSWYVGGWDLGDFMEFILHNEDTGESYPIGDFGANPYAGSFQFWLPWGLRGEHWRIYIDGFRVNQVPDLPGDGDIYNDGVGETDITESTRSAVVAIR